MASLSNIKKRINSIHTTSKITQAMKLVATAKIQYQKNEFFKISEYTTGLYKLLHNLTKSASYAEVFDTKNNSSKNLWIVVSSSLGLCGSYNNAICKYALNCIKSEDEIIVFGEKANSFFKAKDLGKKIIYHFEFNEKKVSYLDIWPIAQIIMKEYQNNTYKSINIIYTKYKNSLSSDPISLQIFPFDPSLFQYDKKSITSEEYNPDDHDHNDLNENGQIIEFFPSRNTIIKHFMEFYLNSIICCCVSESRLCEYSSRRNAMESATDNANELISQLQLEYNQARQEKITQEINEIIAGSEN